MIGVELGGALKNVVAIAVGICDGLELGLNARAGVMTRGLHEITQLGVKMGADPITFLGLAGMGDLVLTCTGDLSRNRRVGLALGRGRKLAEIVASMNEVAEGVRTTHAACALADLHGVEMPIAQSVRSLLEGEVEPKEGRGAPAAPPAPQRERIENVFAFRIRWTRTACSAKLKTNFVFKRAERADAG